MHSVSVTLWAGSGGRFVVGVGFFVGASMADRGVLLMLSAQGESQVNFKEAANWTKARLDGKEWKNVTIAEGLCMPRAEFGGERVPNGGGRSALRNAHCSVRQDVRSRMARSDGYRAGASPTRQVVASIMNARCVPANWAGGSNNQSALLD